MDKAKDERIHLIFDIIGIVITTILIIAGVICLRITYLHAPYHHSSISNWISLYIAIIFWSIVFIASISWLLYGVVYTRYKEVKTWGRKSAPKSPRTSDDKGTTTVVKRTERKKMSYQGKVRPKYLWRVPLAGAILTLIGFFTPLAYITDYSGSIYMWIWGLNIFEFSGYGTEILFTQNPEILIPSIICSIGIFFSIIIMFGSVSLYKIRTVNERLIGNGLLGASIVAIVCTIGWIVTLEVVWPGSYSFWDVVDPHFGVFGLFIGSGISIVGYGLSRYYGSQREAKSTTIVVKRTEQYPERYDKDHHALRI